MGIQKDTQNLIHGAINDVKQGWDYFKHNEFTVPQEEIRAAKQHWENSNTPLANHSWVERAKAVGDTGLAVLNTLNVPGNSLGAIVTGITHDKTLGDLSQWGLLVADLPHLASSIPKVADALDKLPALKNVIDDFTGTDFAQKVMIAKQLKKGIMPEELQKEGRITFGPITLVTKHPLLEKNPEEYELVDGLKKHKLYVHKSFKPIVEHVNTARGFSGLAHAYGTLKGINLAGLAISPIEYIMRTTGHVALTLYGVGNADSKTLGELKKWSNILKDHPETIHNIDLLFPDVSPRTKALIKHAYINDLIGIKSYVEKAYDKPPTALDKFFEKFGIAKLQNLLFEQYIPSLRLSSWTKLTDNFVKQMAKEAGIPLTTAYNNDKIMREASIKALKLVDNAIGEMNSDFVAIPKGWQDLGNTVFISTQMVYRGARSMVQSLVEFSKIPKYLFTGDLPALWYHNPVLWTTTIGAAAGALISRFYQEFHKKLTGQDLPPTLTYPNTYAPVKQVTSLSNLISKYGIAGGTYHYAMNHMLSNQVGSLITVLSTNRDPRTHNFIYDPQAPTLNQIIQTGMWLAPHMFMLPTDALKDITVGLFLAQSKNQFLQGVSNLILSPETAHFDNPYALYIESMSGAGPTYKATKGYREFYRHILDGPLTYEGLYQKIQNLQQTYYHYTNKYLTPKQYYGVVGSMLVNYEDKDPKLASQILDLALATLPQKDTKYRALEQLLQYNADYPNDPIKNLNTFYAAEKLNYVELAEAWRNELNGHFTKYNWGMWIILGTKIDNAVKQAMRAQNVAIRQELMGVLRKNIEALKEVKPLGPHAQHAYRMQLQSMTQLYNYLYNYSNQVR